MTRPPGSRQRSLWRRLVLTTVAALLASCAPDAKDPASKNTNAEPPGLIGRIASIPPGKRFVLIQSYDQRKIEPGTILTTRGPDNRTANLLATGESLGAFTAADIQSGTVETGDAVYTRHVPQAPDASAAPPASDPAPNTGTTPAPEPAPGTDGQSAAVPEPAAVTDPELPQN